MFISMNTSPPASPAVCDINQGVALNAATITLVGAAAVVVAARFAVRFWIVKDIGWDDWTILLAMLGTIIGGALDIVEVHYGFGMHQNCLTEHQLLEFQKYVWGEWIQTFASLMWTKVSICLFLLRIPIQGVLIRPLQVGVVILIVSNVVLTLCWILQCHPVDAAWNIKIKGQCFSRGQKQRIIMAQAVISVVSDFAFASFPILLLWNIQMELRKKIGLCLLMGFGLITGSCCIVRTVLNFEAVPSDAPYGGITNWYWRTFEVQFGIMAACIPTLPPGYKFLRNRWSPKNSSTGHLPLFENPEFRPTEDPKIHKSLKTHRADLEMSNASLSTRQSQIHKTIRIDVDRSSQR